MRALSFFLWRYRLRYAAVLVVITMAAIVDALALAVLYPLLSTVLGVGEDSAAGAVLGTLAALVRAFPPEQRVLAALGLFLVVVPVASAMKLLREWLQSSVSGSVTYEVKREVFERLRSAPYATFLESRQGDLSYRLSVAPQNLALALLSVAMVASYGFSGLGTFGLLLSIEPRITLAMAALGAVFFGMNRFVARRFSVNAGREKLRAQSAELGVVQELVVGAREIIAAGTGASWADRFARQADTYRRYFVRDLTWSAVPGIVLELTVFVLAALVAGGLRLIVGGDVIVLLPVLTIYVYGVRQLLSVVGVISRLLLRIAALTPDVALLERSLTEQLPVVREGDRPVPPWRELRLEDVSFSYPGRGAVLRGITSCFRRGTTTAIVGASGVGKTTILAILLRLLEPTEGRVLLDETDLGEIRRADWLARVGYVGQEPFVFGGTIADNIAFGWPTSAPAISAAARAAHAHEFIEDLPDGYETTVGDRGITLSAGQRQRLAIARALVRGPELLVLDEATSALDTVSERLVQQALEEVASRCTVIIVAHRISTVRRADGIIVLERGRVAEVGRHAELLARQGPYAELARSLSEKPAASA